MAQGSPEQHNHTRMSLVIEAEVLILVNPDRQDCPEAVTSRRDATEEKGNGSAKTKCHMRLIYRPSKRVLAATSEPNG